MKVEIEQDLVGIIVGLFARFGLEEISFTSKDFDAAEDRFPMHKLVVEWNKGILSASMVHEDEVLIDTDEDGPDNQIH